jgi:ribonucleoside-diphosphate reductase alpha chain
MHMYAWEAGLKTGMYYLRTKSATDAIKFTVEKQSKSQVTPVVVGSKEGTEESSAVSSEALKASAASFEKGAAEMNAKTMAEAVRKQYTEAEALACSIDNPDDCEACGS